MERSSRSVALPPLSGARVALQGWLSLLNRLWMFFSGSHRYFFSTLPRSKPIEIDSRVPILSLRVHQRKAVKSEPNPHRSLAPTSSLIGSRVYFLGVGENGKRHHAHESPGIYAGLPILLLVDRASARPARWNRKISACQALLIA